MENPVRLRSLVFALLTVSVAALSSPASGASGFIVSASKTKPLQRGAQIAIMRDGTHTTLSIQTNYEGPPEDFALIVPVPTAIRKEDVRTLPNEVFDRLDQVTAPRLVEYFEQDPCQTGSTAAPAGSPASSSTAIPYAMNNGPFRRGLHHRVIAEAQFVEGEYTFEVLSATDSAALEAWLKREKYLAPEGSAAMFDPYVKSGSRFVVAKVNAKKVKLEKRSNGDVIAKLAPIRLTYETPSFSVPVRLGLLNAKGPLDVIVYALGHKQRFEAANLPNVTIATNLDVGEKARGEFESFYTALFDKVASKTPKAVVTEYAWDVSSCEACTVPPLSFSELGSLGGDTLPLKGDDIPVPSFRGVPREAGAPPAAASASASPTATAVPSAASTGHHGSVLHVATKDLSVTRMHLRYTKETMPEDLVLRAAEPLTGGREVRGSTGELESTTVGGTLNAFMARYTVRHPFAGQVTCKDPHRGVWGSNSSDAPVTSVAAKDLVFAPHTGTPLASYLIGSVKGLDVTGTAQTPQGATPTSAPPPSTTGPTLSAAPSATTTAQAPAAPAPKSGCGCHAVGASRGTSPASITACSVVLAGLLASLRRRAQSTAKRSDSGTTP